MNFEYDPADTINELEIKIKDKRCEILALQTEILRLQEVLGNAQNTKTILFKTVSDRNSEIGRLKGIIETLNDQLNQDAFAIIQKQAVELDSLRREVEILQAHESQHMYEREKDSRNT